MTAFYVFCSSKQVHACNWRVTTRVYHDYDCFCFHDCHKKRDAFVVNCLLDTYKIVCMHTNWNMMRLTVNSPTSTPFMDSKKLHKYCSHLHSHIMMTDEEECSQKTLWKYHHRISLRYLNHLLWITAQHSIMLRIPFAFNWHVDIIISINTIC